jgi:SAM-dependent methyltransferase
MMKARLRGARALEIGGPSRIFSVRGRFPVYSVLAGIDNANFRETTVWSRSDEERMFGHELCRRYVAEATSLSEIASDTYDAVLASHVLEHTANPLKAIHEWLRVIRPGGTLVIVVPNRVANFDRKRPFTSIEHILDDFSKHRSEDDLTHLEEILQLHDLSLDPLAGTREQFRARALQNAENRCLHHHVFSLPLLTRLLEYAAAEIVYSGVELPHHLVAVAIKTGQPVRA